MDKAEKQRKLRHYKKMQKECNDKHPTHIINANPNLRIDLDYCLEKEVGADVLSVLRELSEGVYYRCPNCGGLLPEIVFHTADRDFLFTCTQIAGKEGKVIAETDYKLMENYLQASNNKKD